MSNTFYCATLESDCTPHYFQQELNAIIYVMSGTSFTSKGSSYDALNFLMKHHEIPNIGYYDKITLED